MTAAHDRLIDRLDHESLIVQLEEVVASKDVGHRAAMLRRVTDLFVLGTGKLSDEQIAVFDDVMSRLVEEIEIGARAAFGRVLATLPDAPPNVIRRLALDEEIGVAGGILSHSERVDEATLVESAKTRGQEHLLAISQRKVLAETVTDILVERGSQEVVLRTAGNPGAAFSEFGYSTLVRRSSDHDDLAACIWSRPEIPRQYLLKLFATASKSVRLELTKKDPHKASFILELVAQATNQIQTQTREQSPGYASASVEVRSLQEAGNLSEAQLAKFARAEKFDETMVALATICDLPVGLIERAFVDDRPEQIIVLTKAAGLSWDTTKAILLLQAGTKTALNYIFDRHFETFTQLKAETAKKAISFYRMRERAATPRRS